MNETLEKELRPRLKRDHTKTAVRTIWGGGDSEEENHRGVSSPGITAGHCYDGGEGAAGWGILSDNAGTTAAHNAGGKESDEDRR